VKAGRKYHRVAEDRQAVASTSVSPEVSVWCKQTPRLYQSRGRKTDVREQDEAPTRRAVFSKYKNDIFDRWD
jgi:hypothetical protein